MTKNELLELVHNMANTCLDCLYPQARPFARMERALDRLKADFWYNVPFGDSSDGSALLRGDYGQMKIWLNGVDVKNDREELSIRTNLPTISIFHAVNDSSNPIQYETFVKCTINTRKPHDLRFRGGDSKDGDRRTEWWWTRYGELNAHKPGETDSFYLNDPYWEDIVDFEVMDERHRREVYGR